MHSDLAELGGDDGGSGGRRGGGGGHRPDREQKVPRLPLGDRASGAVHHLNILLLACDHLNMLRCLLTKLTQVWAHDYTRDLSSAPEVAGDAVAV